MKIKMVKGDSVKFASAEHIVKLLEEAGWVDVEKAKDLEAKAKQAEELKAKELAKAKAKKSKK